MRKMAANAQEIKTNARAMDDKMDANARKMDDMKGDLERKMDEGRGEMQCMGLSLQAGQEAMRASLDEVKGIMVPARGGTTEPRRSVECVWPAMEMGEVGTTSDATTIIGETWRVRHEGTMEKLKEVTETEKGETQGDAGFRNNDRDAGSKRGERIK